MTDYDFSNENFQSAFKPMRDYAQWCVECCSKVAKHNHAVWEDCINFYTEQARTPLQGNTANKVFEEQAQQNKKFMELMSSRAQAYVKMTREFQQDAQEKFSNFKFDLKPAA